MGPFNAVWLLLLERKTIKKKNIPWKQMISI